MDSGRERAFYRAAVAALREVVGEDSELPGWLRERANNCAAEQLEAAVRRIAARRLEARWR